MYFFNRTSIHIEDYGCILKIELLYLLKIISDVFFDLIIILIEDDFGYILKCRLFPT